MRVKKVLAALLCFALASCAGFFIKEIIDAANPQYAIPLVTVTADGEPLAVTIEECSWDFLVGQTYNYSGSGLFELDLTRNDLMGGENLNISFSQQPEAVKIYRSESYSYDFSVCDGSLLVPYESGGYLYQVYAQFGRGHEVIYFYIVVK